MPQPRGSSMEAPGGQPSAAAYAVSTNGANSSAGRAPGWQAAIQLVQHNSKQQREAEAMPDALGLSEGSLLSSETPSIIAQHRVTKPAAVGPRLAVIVHALHTRAHLENPVYVKASLHSSTHSPVPAAHKHPKTAPARQALAAEGAVGGVLWGSLLRLHPPAVHGMVVHLTVKSRQGFGRKPVVWGSVVVPLQEVLEQPELWGSKQAHALRGGRLAAWHATLELQAFLSTDCVSGPLRVLAATWNVGNALPPPPEQLQGWLKGSQQQQHHLVAVAAQECNYMQQYQHMKRTATATAQLAASATGGSAASTTGAGSAGASEGAGGTHESPPQPRPDQAAAEDAAAAADGLFARRALPRAEALKGVLLDQLDSSAMWERHISSTLGEQYWLVASRHMFQTRLLLFARGDVLPAISAVDGGFEATGVGHIGLNKGGVAVGLKVDATHLVFVGSHLAAHQGKTQQRNTDVLEITHNLRLSSSPAAAGADLVTGSHHTVWMGDLNYRLDYGAQAETQADSPTPEDFAALSAAVRQRQFVRLLQLDQLAREMAAGRVFSGFSEGAIGFAPTFKVARGQPGCVYTPRRSPAWCDRVLTKSLLPHKPARCVEYLSAPEVATSDHKPVAALLSLPLATHTVTGQATHSRSGAGWRGRPQADSPACGSGSVAAPGGRPSNSNSNGGAVSMSSVKAALAGLASRGSRGQPNHSSSIGSGGGGGVRANSDSSSQHASSLPFKLYMSKVQLADAATCAELVRLAAHSSDEDSAGRPPSKPGRAPAASVGAAGAPTTSRGSAHQHSNGGAKARRELRLQLVVSGSCLGGPRQEHVFHVVPGAVERGLAVAPGAPQPSLLAQEESVQLLPGPITQLKDEWLLLRLVLVDSWRGRRTLARGVLPLHNAAAEYAARSFKSVAVPLQLEASSALVGGCVCTVQLISSVSVRAGMLEAIRRMRLMAAARRSASDSAAALAGVAPTPSSSSAAWQAGFGAAAGAGAAAGSSIVLANAFSAPPAVAADGPATAAAAAAGPPLPPPPIASIRTRAPRHSSSQDEGFLTTPRSRTAEWLVSGVTPMARQQRLSSASGSGL